MKKEQLQVMDGFLVIDLIDTKPIQEGIKLINPNTGKETASYSSYEDHPFRALIVKVCAYYTNNGIQYESQLNEGDIVLLPGWPIKPELCIIENNTYSMIRHSEVLGYYTPTEEQRSKIITASKSDKNYNAKELVPITTVKGEA